MIPSHVITQYIEGAYAGCEKSIRDDLSVEEEKILERMKAFMSTIKTEKTQVFCAGNYPRFLEGVLKAYNNITVIYTCDKLSWSEVFNPQQCLDLFMEKNGKVNVLKREAKILSWTE